VPDRRDDLEDLLGRCLHVDGDDVRARDHDLVDRLLRDREDRGDHPLLALLDHTLRLSRLDERLDLVLGHERTRLGIAPERSREQAGQDEEHRHERPHQPRDELERPHEDQQDGLRMAGANGARDEDSEQHGHEAERRDRHRNRGDVAHDWRAGAKDESQQVRQARRDVRRGDAGEREDDEELGDLYRCQVFDGFAAHRPGAPTAAAASGKLLDQLRPPDGVERGLAGGQHREGRDERELQ
jgi:hypothetical protein